MARVNVVLKMPTRIGDFIVFARFVVDCLAADPLFVSPRPRLATVRKRIAALEKAQTRALTRAHGTVEARKACQAEVATALRSLRTYVQRLVVGKPNAEAAAIVEKAGMRVKNARGPAKLAFTVKYGRVSGSVALVARASRTTASYEWEHRVEDGPWKRAAPTVQANQTLTGLEPGKMHSFRYRSVTRDGVGRWSEVIRLIVR